MAKTSGLGDNLYVGGRDLSGDIGSIETIHGGVNPLQVTGIDKYAFERLGGIRSSEINFTAWHNDALTQAHPTLSALPAGDVLVTYCRGTTLGNAAACQVSKQLDYAGTRAADGALTYSAPASSNGYGLEWGKQLTAGKRTDTTATNGTSVDFTSSAFAGSSTFGLQAYLQVFSFTGTSVTIAIQESSDNGAGDAFAAVTGGAFTVVTAGPTTERIATSASQTVERYLRVVTTGTFSSVVFAVMVNRNDTATSF